MKTKLSRIAQPPVPADQEPTDDELQAIEDSGESAEHFDASPFGSTPLDLARVGLNEIAYVRHTVVDDAPVWAIFSATGHPLGAAPTLDQAWGAVVQNDLIPVHVH